MKQIIIADHTLCANEEIFSFKEKLEIARQLERLCADVIELGEIVNEKADTLFVRTAASLLHDSVLSVAVGAGPASLSMAISALSGVKRGRIRLEMPMSPVGMEYLAHKKPDAMVAYVSDAVKTAKAAGLEVELCCEDATRAEKEFLLRVIRTAEEAGIGYLTLCDSAAEMLPDDIAAFVSEIAKAVSVPVGVRCNNKNGLAVAASILSVRHGAVCIKTDASGILAPIDTVAALLRDCGNTYGYSTRIRITELHRIVGQINWIVSNAKNEKSVMTVSGGSDDFQRLDAKDDQATVSAAVMKLGYDLSEEDQKCVYDEFLRVAQKKSVGPKELDAIIASVALQVPGTYQLVNYVINNGNIISSSAQITLARGEEQMMGISIGDGPIDAAFKTIDGIIGHHYELDDFQIQSVTEGKEAMGSALVKLRSGGKLYSGNGISTDIIGASIRAYLSAVNKIVYEEE